MNNEKVNRLLEAARNEAVPEPRIGFEARVMGEIRRETMSQPISWLDQFGGLLPRVAMGTALVIGLSVAVDLWLGQNDLSGSLAEASEEWFFAVK
jgi:hypothetical protein